MGKRWIRKALFSLNLGGGIVYTLRNTIGGEYTAVGLHTWMKVKGKEMLHPKLSTD